MAQKIIKIRISGGKVTVNAEGFKGKACVEDMKWLDEILGSPNKRLFKDEYHKVEGIKIRG